MKLTKFLFKEEVDRTPDPEEISMVLNNLKQIFEYAKEAYQIVETKPNVEEWIQEKIAVSAHELETVISYLKFNPDEQQK